MSENILVYGSLLDIEDLNECLSPSSTKKVKVDGYIRCFNQVSDVRNPGNGTVLNVVEKSDFHINAILALDVDNEHVEKYKNRESGYSFETVESDRVNTYNEDDCSINSIIAVGDLTTEPSSGLKPIPSYTSTVISGASQWGNDFLTDFILTTYRWPMLGNKSPRR